MFERFFGKRKPATAWPTAVMPDSGAGEPGQLPREMGPLRLAPDLASAVSRMMARMSPRDVKPFVPVAAHEVQAVFARLGSVATPDVLAFYAALGAGGADGLGEPLLEVWSLQQVAGQERSDRGVLFADFLISSHEYRLVRIDDAQSAVCIDHHDNAPLRTGPTLEAFLISLESDENFVHAFR